MSADPRSRLRTMEQEGRGASPWPLSVRIKGYVWHLVWLFLFRPTPKPLIGWRNFLLRAFGCRMTGRPYVANNAIIKYPWLLTMEDKASIGFGAEVYNLGPVTLRARCTIAQQAYLCTGTHDLSDPVLPLVTGEIIVGEDAFVGARVLVLPGVHIGEGAAIGAGSVVTKDMPAWTISAGNPCRPIKPRQWRGERSSGAAAPAAEGNGELQEGVPRSRASI